MAERAFFSKWDTIKSEDRNKDNLEERSIFVDVGKLPETQRQFNLYHYFEFIRSVLVKKGSRKVLEIGCGRGTIGLYMAKHMGLDVSLLDHVPSALALAKEEFESHGQQAQYYVDDVLKTKFPSGLFDAVVSIGLAEHFEAYEIDALFKEQYRILRPGGVMISLNIPKKHSAQELNFAMRAVKKLLGAYKGEVRKDYFRNRLKPPAFKAHAIGVGFEKVYFFHTFPFPFFIPVRMTTDRFLTKIFLKIVAFRRLFMAYPYKTNRVIGQSHFLVAEKPVR